MRLPRGFRATCEAPKNVAEEFWATIEDANQRLCQEALDLLAPFGDSRLAALIRQQMGQNAAQWASQKSYRVNLRAIFNIP